MDFKIKIDEDQGEKKQHYSSAQDQEEHKAENLNLSPGREIVNNQTDAIKSSPSSTSMCACFSFEYYQPYFDLDSKQVGQRILYSFLPINPKLSEIIEPNPDVYGPFWIYTTIIFLVAAAGNLSRYLKISFNENKEEFFYDFNFVPIATCLIYTYGSAVPLLLLMLLKWGGSNTNFSFIFCLYGYSMAPFLLIILICGLPFDLLQWLLLAYAVTNSSLILLLNFWKKIAEMEKRKKYVTLGFIGGCQGSLLIMFKLFFFSKYF